MTMRMLIDARHREETRVAVVKGNRIEEFDFESVEHQQIKGNIYLAKVTRVEPSLQAAFVDYGGNRHGFLAFSEIHPDYYQIPKEDRDRLLAEEAEHAAEEEALRARAEEAEEAEGDDDGDMLEHDIDAHDSDNEDDIPRAARENNGDDHAAAEALRSRRMNLRRRYKIQDVIHRRQVLLVQVVKEERGNKGAALTTYLSLAGRYCVLMPNTTHGGGISRKISNVSDRKRLKTIMAELNLPSTMGCIVRTAGLQRTKIEIKRDFDYLARLWDGIRDTTLSSSAPAQIYTDSDLIRRAIRDIYNKDIDEVIVEGEEGFRQAREFMKLLMPSHARKIKPYADAVPLFQRYGAEDQLAAMYQPVVQLKSGGYLVINPTEALVSIDINSGRSTREHGIEATAVGTNLEAAHEIARQLRLRDMAGLVVIDFIDMENNSNIRKVEKTMKAALANDRARIQVGRISSFGLMEMSRQRLRTGVLEASTKQCPHCEGTGLVRTASSAGLSALRMLEEEAARGKGSILTMRASQEAAFYLLNRKRHELAEIEQRYGVRIEVLSDGETQGARMIVELSGPPPAFTPTYAPVVFEADDEEFEDEVFAEDEDEASEARSEHDERSEGEGEGGARKKRNRRRRGRRGRNDMGGERAEGDEVAPRAETDEEVSPEGNDEVRDGAEYADVTGESAEGAPRRSRRGRRGGRRRREGQAEGQSDTLGHATEGEGDQDAAAAFEATPDVEVATPSDAAEVPAPKPRRGRAKQVAAIEVANNENALETEANAMGAAADVGVEPEKPRRGRKPKAAVAAEASVTPEAAPVEADAKPKRARKPKAADVEAATTIVHEPMLITPEPLAAPLAVQEAPEVTASQPVAVASVAGAAEVAEGESDEAPRRGWWQRTFGE